MREYVYLLIGFAIVGGAVTLYQLSRRQAIAKQIDVSPLEDLMREHGVLHRLLLIYQECIFRLKNGENIDCTIIEKAAGIIQLFIEGYHEKDEENYIFPRFQKKGVMVDLVKILLDQHEKGRALTAKIKEYAHDGRIESENDREQLISYMNSFITMYRAHAAREDTELYPAFYTLISPQEYEQLAHLFEEEEERILGEHAFERIVQSIIDLEKQLGIANLNYYTPKR